MISLPWPYKIMNSRLPMERNSPVMFETRWLHIIQKWWYIFRQIFKKNNLPICCENLSVLDLYLTRFASSCILYRLRSSWPLYLKKFDQGYSDLDSSKISGGIFTLTKICFLENRVTSIMYILIEVEFSLGQSYLSPFQ